MNYAARLSARREEEAEMIDTKERAFIRALAQSNAAGEFHTMTRIAPLKLIAIIDALDDAHALLREAMDDGVTSPDLRARMAAALN
jgi:hypothetical protein